MDSSFFNLGTHSVPRLLIPLLFIFTTLTTKGYDLESHLSITVDSGSSSETYFLGTQGATNTNGLNFPYAIVLTSSQFGENLPPHSQSVLLSTFDPDVGDKHTYSLISGLGGEDNSAFTLVGSELRPVVTFDSSVKNTYNVRINSIDLTGLSITRNFVFTIVNVPPTVLNPIADVSLNEDATDSTIDLSNVFNDVDNNNAAIVKSVTSSNNSLVNASVAGNTLTLDYQPNQSGSATITVTANSNGKTVDDVFSVTVIPVDDSPVVANPLSDITVNEDAVNSIIDLSNIFNDVDDNNASITKSVTSSNNSLVNASVADNTLTLDYQPNQSGSATITVTANSNGKTVDDVFSVTVNPVDDYPVVANPLSDITVNEDAVNSIIDLSNVFNDVDDNNASITKSVTSSDSSLVNASIVGNTLTLDYQPNQSGSATITVTANSNGKTVDDVFSTSVNPVNDPPIITTLDGNASSGISILENQISVIDVNATDLEGDILSYLISGGLDQSKFDINSSTGELKFITNPDFENPADSDTNNIYLIEVTVRDNGLGSPTDTQNIAITIIDANDPPVVANAISDISLNEDSSDTIINLENVFDDQDDDNVSITKSVVSSDTSLVTASIVGNTLTLDYQSNQSGSATITVTANSNGQTVNDVFSVNVNSVDDAPTIANPQPDFSVDEDASNSNIDLSNVFNDVDNNNDAITKSVASSDNSLITASISGNTLILNYQPNQNGTATISVTANSNGQTVNDVFSVNVNPVDDHPVVANAIPDLSVNENSSVTNINLSNVYNDVDDDNASISKSVTSSNPSLVSATVIGNTLTLSYQNNETGNSTITVTGSSNGKTVDDVFLVNVLSVNMAPVITSLDGNTSSEISIIENRASVTTIVATDPNGDNLSYSIIGGSDQAKFNLNVTSGVLNFTNPPDYEKPTDLNNDNIYTVQILVEDDQTPSLSDSQLISVIVMDDKTEDLDGDGTPDHLDDDKDGDGFSNSDEIAYGSDPRDPHSVANAPPTNLKTNAPLTLAENQPIGTVTGSLSALDPDANATLSYFLVSGTGDTDNSLFSLQTNGTLSSRVVFDFENNASTYSIRAEVKDQYDAMTAGVFTISLTDLFEDLDGDGTADHLDTDIDGDGISNSEEILTGTNPNDPDSDKDGLTDGEEKTLGTNPVDSETEAEGTSKEVEQDKETSPLAKGFWSDLEALSIGYGWYDSKWFGVFHASSTSWIYHLNHGWLYLENKNQNDFWIFDNSLGWIYTNKYIFPYLFIHNSSSWIYDRSSTSKRVFWNYKTSEYFSILKN